MNARAYRVRGGYVIPLLGMLICLWLTAQANAQNWKTVGILLAIGFVLYALERRFLQR
jgi:positive regulator of sigma E activity